MIIKKDLRGFFKWIIMDSLVFVDPKWMIEYETYVLLPMDNAVNS